VLSTVGDVLVDGRTGQSSDLPHRDNVSGIVSAWCLLVALIDPHVRF